MRFTIRGHSHSAYRWWSLTSGTAADLSVSERQPNPEELHGCRRLRVPGHQRTRAASHHAAAAVGRLRADGDNGSRNRRHAARAPQALALAQLVRAYSLIQACVHMYDPYCCQLASRIRSPTNKKSDYRSNKDSITNVSHTCLITRIPLHGIRAPGGKRHPLEQAQHGIQGLR